MLPKSHDYITLLSVEQKILPNVKEHATLSAEASVDHRVEVEATEDHVNRAADRGCCVSSCSLLLFSSDAATPT